jgi:hypothetical protein
MNFRSLTSFSFLQLYLGPFLWCTVLLGVDNTSNTMYLWKLSDSSSRTRQLLILLTILLEAKVMSMCVYECPLTKVGLFPWLHTVILRVDIRLVSSTPRASSWLLPQKPDLALKIPAAITDIFDPMILVSYLFKKSENSAKLELECGGQ